MDDNLSYVSEFEHTSPRCSWRGTGPYGDTGSLNEVARLLNCLLSAGEAGGRTGSVIEILVMRALTHHAGGDTPSALAPLERAPTLAEPEGSVQVFVGEGPPTASLLTAVASRGPRVGLRSSTPGRLYPRRCDRPRGDPRRTGHPPQEWTRRAADLRTLRQGRSLGARPWLLGHPSGEHRKELAERRTLDCTASLLRRRPFPGLPHHIPIGRVTTSITTSGDVGSPHRLLPFDHTSKRPGDPSG